MKNLWILGALVLSLFSMNRANSSILVEPYVGGHFFASEIDTGTSDDLSGMAYGARIGWQNLGFMLGANYKTGSFERDGVSADIDSYTNMGAFIGYNFPAMIRVWVEYTFSSTMEFEGGTEIENGTGTTFGFGYTAFPFISINLELSKTDGYELSSNGNDANVDFSTTMLSVSFPFTL